MEKPPRMEWEEGIPDAAREDEEEDDAEEEEEEDDNVAVVLIGKPPNADVDADDDDASSNPGVRYDGSTCERPRAITAPPPEPPA